MRRLRIYGCRRISCPMMPRLEVLVRWGSKLYRLLPGSFERPVATIDHLRLLAKVIDPVLVDRLGFGLEDAVELVLRRIDHVSTVLAPLWSPIEVEIGMSPFISAEELVAAGTLLDISSQVERCCNPDRARSALEYHSVRPNQLAFDLSSAVAQFGTTIAVRKGPLGLVPLPAGLLVETLDAMGSSLANKASQFDASVERRWRLLVRHLIGYMLQNSGHPISGPLKTAEGRSLHSLITYTPRQALVLDTVAGLRSSSLQEERRASIENLDSISPGVELSTRAGSLQIDADAQVYGIQVIAPAGAEFARNHDEHTVVHLKDILWFARTAARHPEDLWYFVRDFTHLNATTPTFVFDMIDTWQVWQSNDKSFYRGGTPIDSMMFEPHQAAAEWLAAAEGSAVERALLPLKLPHLSAWPIFDDTHDDTHDDAYLADFNQYRSYRLLPWSTPVAVAMLDSHGPSKDTSILRRFAYGIIWRLAYVKDAFLAAASGANINALRIEFARDSESYGPPLRLLQRDDPVIVIGWSARLELALREDAPAVEALFGRLVAQIFDSASQARLFTERWNDAPPSIRMDKMNVEQSAWDLPDPIGVHASQRSVIRRQLGEHLLASSVAAGSYEGHAAKCLENESVYPWLIEQLHHVMETYSAEALLELALTQLEYANSKLWWINQRLGFQMGFPVHADPGSDPSGERREQIAVILKCIALIIEEILARPPSGTTCPDDFTWNEALSVADLCLGSCFRSESIHLRLVRTTVTVTDLFEIGVASSKEPTDVDFHAYLQRRKAATLPEPIPIGTSTIPDPEQAQQEDQVLIRHLMPELADIDLAMLDNLGFGLNALTGVLGVARCWDVTPEEPFATSTLDDFTNAAVPLIVGATREECRYAIDWLTLRGSELPTGEREYWKTEQRAARVTARPFIEFGTRLYVLPWSASKTLEIVTVYLGDGRLPWPARVLPEEVNQAVNQYRQAKNRQLEKDCLTALSDPQLVTCGSIKPNKAERLYGIKSLPGEIDVICVDPKRSRIWVIEAKDPYIPFSLRQIRKEIDDFHELDKYVDKLLRKVDVIRSNAVALTSALRIDNPNREWETLALMATRRTSPAAFALNSRVPFCTIEELTGVIDAPMVVNSSFVVV